MRAFVNVEFNPFGKPHNSYHRCQTILKQPEIQYKTCFCRKGTAKIRTHQMGALPLTQAVQEHQKTRPPKPKQEAFHIPFESRVNPHEEAVRVVAADTVINKLGIPKSHPFVQCITHTDMVRFVCRITPDLPSDALALSIEAWSCILLLDGVFDTVDISDEHAFRLQNRMEAISKDPDCVTEDDDLLLKWWASILASLAARDMQWWFARFRVSVEQYVQACRWKRVAYGGSTNGEGPRLVSSLKTRSHTVGVRFGLALTMLLAVDRNAPMEAVAHVVVDELAATCAKHVACVNDIMSLRRELDAGERENVVMIVARERQLAWPDAMAFVIGMCNEEMESFLEIEQLVTRCVNARDDDPVFVAIEAMKSFMTGNLDWSFETPRYGLSDHV